MIVGLPGRPRLRTEDTKRYQGQLASAVAYCHKQGVAHRDLKPENIAFDASGRDIKVLDFGCAVIADRPRTDVVGSFPFMAPEVFVASSSAVYEPKHVDVWACAVILLEMMCGPPCAFVCVSGGLGSQGSLRNGSAFQGGSLGRRSGGRQGAARRHRSGSRPKYYPEKGPRGSDLDDSWHCLGAALVLHWCRIGARLAVYPWSASLRIVLRSYYSDTSAVAVQ